MYGAYRKTKYFTNSSDLNSYLSFFSNSENCDTLKYDDLIKKENLINYGDNISDILTEPFIILNKRYKTLLNQIKKKFNKNVRKPTEILVFTDGFSYSSAAVFLKYFQYYGGGITAGYFLNPKLKNFTFDSGLSPSLIFDYIRLQLLSPEGYKPLYQNNNFIFQIPGIQTFYTPNNLSIPLEFMITPVDEKVNIYEMFDESVYDIFVNESLIIFDKYKKRCNPKNKKLILISGECDGTFGNSYTHGGYECGDDGFWKSKGDCVSSYCDIGYIFDYNQQKCIIDVCSDRDEKGKDEEENNNLLYYILFPIIGVILIFGIILVFITYKKRKLNHKKNIYEEEKFINKIENIDTP